MNPTKLSQWAPCHSLAEKCRQLWGYQLRKKYDMSVWIYPDEQSDTPECAHRWTGDSRHHIWKLVCAIGGLLLLGSALRWICHTLWD